MAQAYFQCPKCFWFCFEDGFCPTCKQVTIKLRSIKPKPKPLDVRRKQK